MEDLVRALLILFVLITLPISFLILVLMVGIAVPAAGGIILLLSPVFVMAYLMATKKK